MSSICIFISDVDNFQMSRLRQALQLSLFYELTVPDAGESSLIPTLLTISVDYGSPSHLPPPPL